MPLAVVIALTVGVPALLAGVSGSLAIPHNDSWAYSLIAQRFAGSGSITLVGANRAFLLGQVVLLAPFGTSILAEQVGVAVLAAVAIAATFLLLRTAMSRNRALFATLIVGVFLGFGLLATSFMEDVPAYCAIVATLVIGQIAIKRRSIAGVGIALAVGVWGFTIREQALAGVVCVLVAAFFSWRDRESRRKLWILIVLGLAAVVALEAWRQSLANAETPGITLHEWRSGVRLSIAAIFTLGLAVLPATVAVSRPSAWSVKARWAAGITAAAGAVVAAKYQTVLMGNYLDWHGAYSIMSVGTRDVLPHVALLALQGAAWIGGILLVGTVIDARRSVGLVIGLFGLLTAVGTIFEALAGQPVFDRYLLPLMPVALILVLGASSSMPISRRRVLGAAATLAGVGAVSLAITVNALSFDAARWNAAQGLVSRGIPPASIDAGFEWAGYHYAGRTAQASRSVGRVSPPWYTRFFPGAPECYVIAASPQRSLGRLVGIHDYHTFLAFGHGRVLTYKTGRCQARN